MKEDWDVVKYIGLHMKLDYQGMKVYVVMPGYEQKAMAEFQHKIRKRKQFSPFAYARKIYGKELHIVEEPKSPKILDKTGQKLI